jgi:uncharacterized protein YndB with AHSA1/START domain
MPTKTTRVSCHINAPREKVYRALLDSEAVQHWMVPDGMASEVHLFEAQIGGRLRISLTYDSPAETGKSSAHTDTYYGRFVELIPDEKVVQTMAFETDDPRMMGEMQVTYALTEVSGGTELRAVHDFVPDGISAEDNELGWRLSLDKLRRLVEAGN